MSEAYLAPGPFGSQVGRPPGGAPTLGRQASARQFAPADGQWPRARHNEPMAPELASMRAEDVLAALVEVADDAILVCDQYWRVASWGPGAARVFGRSAADALGRPLLSLFAAGAAVRVRKALEQVEGGVAARHIEVEAERGDGLAVPVALSVRGVSGSGGDRTGAVVVARDTTEQILAQAALAEAQARSERSEALAGVGTWLWDVASGAVQWSAEFHRLHGIDPLNFAGTLDAYLAAISEQDRARFEYALRASVATGKAFEEHYRVRLPEGRCVVVRARAEPALGPDGSVVGLRGVGQLVPFAGQAPDKRASAGAGE